MGAKARSAAEEVTKAGFEAFLRATLPESTLVWCDGEDPPDYYLEIDGETYAVEVTILPLRPKRSRSSPPRVVAKQLESFVRSIECCAKNAGVLSGIYGVYIPRPIPDLKRETPRLKKSILTFLRDTAGSPAGVDHEFHNVGGRRCVIRKCDALGANLYFGGPSDSRRAREAEHELGERVSEAIRCKAAKLQMTPKILLLDEHYPFSERSMYQSLPRPECSSDFQAIYMHRHGNDVYGRPIDGILLTSRMKGLHSRGAWDDQPHSA